MLIFLSKFIIILLLPSIKINRSKRSQKAMKLEIVLSDESVEELATAIAAKIGSAASAGDDDDFGSGDEKPAEITLTDVQDAIKEAIGAHGKEKIKALVKKVASAEKVVDIPKEKYAAVLDAIKKVKK